MSSFIDEIIEKDLAEGKVKSVVTRFPPEPNGYLHIGHAKSVFINYYVAAMKYGGKCNLRFDDTNPSKEDEEYVNSIIEDVKWLGWTGDIFYASDYFPTMLECAYKLIAKGLAYVDDISAEDMREMRGTLTTAGKESENRNRSIESSKALFDDMVAGKIADGALVLRAKIDMSSPNINMRDPIIYRVLKAHHHRQGDKWNVYPMYDFAHPIEDAVENITHSICTLEFEDHRPLYDWVINNCEFACPPHQYEFARLNITKMIMSKRYLKKLVDERKVDGWSDPRMPTLSGLRRRGYTPTAIKSFCESIGISKSNSEVDIAQLESSIREELNVTAERAMAVLNPLEMVITNRGDDFCESLEFDVNPSQEGSLKREITISNRIFIDRDDFALDPPPKYHRLTLGGMVRLKSGYIVKCNDVKCGDDGSVERIYCEIVEGTRSGSDNSGIKVKGVIHWVNATTSFDSTVRLYDYLLVDNGKVDFADRLNPDSVKVVTAKLERYLAETEVEHFQFLRVGYFTRDKLAGGFNQTVSLKDSFKKNG